MKLSKKLTPIAAGSALLLAGMVAPITAQAEAGLSASMDVANMYLWRGTDASAGGAAVSGSLGWDSGVGFYVNTWASSGYAKAAGDGYGGYEWDVWAGYAGEISGVSFDVSLWQIMYPEGDGTSTGDSADGLQAGTEISLGLGYQDFSFSYTVNSGERYTGEKDYSYITLGYAFGDFNFKFGKQDVDSPNSDWSHIDVTYALTDAASVTLSKASRQGTGGEEDPLIVFSYHIPFELKK